MSAKTRMPLLQAGAAALVCLLSACTPEAEPEPLCKNCRIELRHVVILGTEQDTVLTTMIPSVAKSTSGAYYVTKVSSPGVVATYDSTGTLLGTFGRLGQGPGEFSTSLTVAASHGVVQVLDRIRQRISTFDETGAMVESVQLPYRAAEQTILGDGTAVVHPDPRPGIETPGFVVVRAGHVVSELRLTNPEPAILEKHWRGLRSIAPAKGTRFWASPMNRYEIELWDAASGTVVTTLTPRPGFDAWDDWETGVPMQAPAPPAVIGLWEQDELLMTLIGQADQNWIGAETGESLDVTPEWQTKYLDTRIDAIDQESGAVVVSTIVDRYLQTVRGAPLLYSVVETPSGEYVIEVLQAVVIRSKD